MFKQTIRYHKDAVCWRPWALFQALA